MARNQIGMPRTEITSGLNILNDSYLGNGVDNREINLGFRPGLVLIKAHTAQHAVFRTTEMPDNEAAYISNGAANLANSIQSFTSKGFIVGTDATANSSGVVYHFFAVADAGLSEFATFSYTGTGSALDITSPGFQPTLVFIKRNGASGVRFRDGIDTSTTSHVLAAAANESNSITAMLTTGFSVGANVAVNNSGDLYYGFAFRDSSRMLIKSGSYTGNATDNRSITGVGFRPDIVMLKSSTDPSTHALRCRMASYPPELTSGLGAGTIGLADNIQAFETDGFQVGADAAVNGNTQVLHYMAFKIHRSRITGTRVAAGARQLVT